MRQDFPSIHALAERLVGCQRARENSSGAGESAVRVVEELGGLLIRLAGADGFRSLLSRALALARTQNPALFGVRVGVSGALEGFENVEPDKADEAGRVLVAHLLELLVTFIGEALTLGLVRDKWAEAVDLTEDGIQ